MLIFSFKFIFARLFLFVYKKSKLIERGVDFLKEGIQKIPSGVRAPKIIIAKACENAKLIGMNGFFRISTKTFYKSCRFNNIKTNLSRGVAPKMKINEAENIINEYRNNGIIVGLTKMYYIINNGNERKCGFKTIQNIYDKNNWIKHKEKKETIYRCRFEAILVNAIWHVDIHYCKKCQV